MSSWMLAVFPTAWIIPLRPTVKGVPFEEFREGGVVGSNHGSSFSENREKTVLPSDNQVRAPNGGV